MRILKLMDGLYGHVHVLKQHVHYIAYNEITYLALVITTQCIDKISLNGPIHTFCADIATKLT